MMNRIQILIAVDDARAVLETAGLDTKVADDVARNIVSSYAIDLDDSVQAKDVTAELARRVRDFPESMAFLAGTDLSRLAEDIHKAIRAA